MPERPFVHLHTHTDYSLLDGACEIGKLMEIVSQLGMPAVAMTDHGNLFGAVQFYHAAKERGIHPVIGCEVYVSQQGRQVRSNTDRYNHLVLLCETQDGYRNLVKLVSAGFLEGFYYKPRIDRDLLSRHAKGLIGMSACLRGDINELLLSDAYDEARRRALEYLDIFGAGNFFLELQDHGLEEDRQLLPQIYRLSQETGIPLVVTNDSHYLQQEDSRVHDILLCVQTGKTISATARMKTWTPHFFIKSRQQMEAVFKDVPDALDRTWEIAQRCQVRLDKIREPFPKFDVPEGHTTDTFFEFAARQGFEARRPRLEALYKAGRLKHHPAEYVQRLDSEIQMIQRMKFSGYFLIVWDFIRYAKSQGIPVGPGRGSAAGSLVSYAMGITDIDPLQYGLLFERFLNPERVTLPDIDIDFCMNRRGEVIQYVAQKYGRDQVAQIITFNTLGARAAIKDVGRVLEMGFAEVDRLTKLVPNVHNITLEEALAKEPKLAEAARGDSRVAEVLRIARRVEGMCRNASIHAAGVVIAPQPLQEILPLYRTNKDEIVTQYDGASLEKLGLLKMDFLGLTTLTVVHDALDLIQQNHGVRLVLEDLPLDDQPTYEIFCKGHTSGIFQFESPGMREILRRYQPSRLEDLIALNALYRPGPLQGRMVDDFIDRKHGRQPVTYELPELKPILEETYGVIVYQEQVMQIANVLAGYSLGEADILRRAMGKKKPEEMAAQRARFISGAKAKGHPERRVARIFDLMEQFAGYGFNKSHSAAYAYLAYVTAYLKAHYPVDFMAALLTSETGNTPKVVKYINECKDMGIAILPPDVNHSGWSFTPDYTCGERGAIRFGLGAIRNVGRTAVEAIQKARSEQGSFRSLQHFCETVELTSLNRRMLESLIKAGAMDSLGGTRGQLFAAIECAMEAGQRAQRDRQRGQPALFSLSPGAVPAPEPPLPLVEDWSLDQRLAGEKEVLGLLVSGHPLDNFVDKVRELATHNSASLEGLEKGTGVVLCGVLTGIQRKRNKEGKPWASLVLDDPQGTVEALVFASNYARLEPQLVEDRAVLVTGSVLPEENSTPKISIADIVPLESAPVSYPTLISVRVWLGQDRLKPLEDLFRRKPGNTSVRLCLEKSRDFQAFLDIPWKIQPDSEFRDELERICGPGSFEILAH
ncbi:MAG: DNA polymerase III subunit alpha [Bryobacteraceae bacterium]